MTGARTPSQTARPGADASAAGGLLRPRSPLLWVYLVVFAAGAAFWSTAYAPSMPAGYWAAAIVWVIVLGILLALLITHLDVYGGTPRPLLVAGFAWGLVPTVGLGVQANAALLDEFERHLAGYQSWATAAVAPVVEESIKTLGIVLVVLLGRRRLVRTCQVGVIGAVIGLGFQMAENINYALNAGSGEMAAANGLPEGQTSADLLRVIGMRTVTALDSHWVYSGVAGLGIGYLIVRRAAPAARRWAAGVGAFVSAVLLHIVVDSPKPLGPAGAVLLLVEIVAVAAAGYVVYRYAMRAEWRRFSAVAAGLPDAVISPDETAAMRTPHTRRRARAAVRRSSGRAAARAVPALRRAQTDLVNALLAGRSADDEYAAVQSLRNRDARLLGVS